MARYQARRYDTRRGRYWRWGVWDSKERRWVSGERGEFAQSRAENHAKFLNSGGFGDWSQVFRQRAR